MSGPAPAPWPPGDGEMARRTRAHDWAATPLGPVEGWSRRLKVMVEVVLASPLVSSLVCGPERVLIYNDAAAHLYGARHPAALGRPLPETFPEGWSTVVPLYARAFAGEVVQVVAQPLDTRGEGEAVDAFDAALVPVRDDAGLVAFVQMTGWEVGSRVRLQAALRESEERHRALFKAAERGAAELRAVLESIGDGVYMGGLEGITLANQPALDQLGFATPEELNRHVGVLAEELQTRDAETGAFIPVEEQAFTRALAGERVVRDVRVRHRLSGEEHVVRCSASPVLMNGRVIAAVAVNTDITDHKRAERALRASEARQAFLLKLSDALRPLGDPVEVQDVAARLVGEHLGSDRTCYIEIDSAQDLAVVTREYLRGEAASLRGKHPISAFRVGVDQLREGRPVVWTDTPHDPRLPESERPSHAALSIVSAVNVPLVKDGELVAILAVANARPRDWIPEEIALLEDASERTWAAVERARAEAALREANETLEARVAERTAELMAAEASLRQAQKMEAVGQLTGGVAHDFNNMLQGISGSLDLARRRVAQGRAAEAGRSVESAQKAVERAAALTHRLLAFARRQHLRPRAVAPNALIEEVAELVRRTVGPAVRVELRLRDSAWPVRCDAGQLESALLNLAVNARDAMPEGGRLAIATRHVRLSAADLAGLDGAAPGEYVEVAVADTGTGMDEATRARAFEPFFTTKPLGQGTGLGLSQVYGFARQSGGLMRLDSAPGRGTTVRLYLPRDTAGVGERGEEAGSERAVAPPSAAADRVLLLVEDEAGVRTVAAERLRELGYAVLEAEDGPTALRLLRAGARVDLLVTDVGLPGGLNGRQVADMAREHRPGLPVLFITGYAGDALDGHLAPGMEVIGKPFALDTLATRVGTMLGATALATETGASRPAPASC